MTISDPNQRSVGPQCHIVQGKTPRCAGDKVDKNECVGEQRSKSRGKRVLNSVPLLDGTWAVICTKKNETTVNGMIKSLKDSSRYLEVNVENPRLLTETARHASGLVDFLKV